jgi:hypothetical protein
MAGGDRVLVHRRLDGWLLGGLGIIAWLAVSPLPLLGGPLLSPLDSTSTWVLLAFASAHFGASYHLAYGGGWAALRRHPLALLVTPVVLSVACLAVIALMAARALGSADWLLRALVLAVFSTTGWHYIKQAYGVALLSLKMGGLAPHRREVMALRFGFYPIWFVDLMDVWAQGHRATYRRYDVSVELLPQGVEQAARILAAGCVVGVLSVLLALAGRCHRRLPMGAWVPYVVGGLWFVLPPSYLSAAAVVGATHSLQYLACVHRAEIEMARERGEQRLVHWWFCVFGGAMAGGLLVAVWLPDLVGRALPALPLPGVVGALAFVSLNLHHYAIDATVWRSGGEHVRRIVGASTATSASTGVTGLLRS